MQPQDTGVQYSRWNDSGHDEVSVNTSTVEVSGCKRWDPLGCETGVDSIHTYIWEICPELVPARVVHLSYGGSLQALLSFSLAVESLSTFYPSELELMKPTWFGCQRSVSRVALHPPYRLLGPDTLASRIYQVHFCKACRVRSFRIVFITQFNQQSRNTKGLAL